MGEVRFAHHGRTGAVVRFPYTAAGSRAIRTVEKTTRRLARRAKGRRSRRG